MLYTKIINQSNYRITTYPLGSPQHGIWVKNRPHHTLVLAGCTPSHNGVHSLEIRIATNLHVSYFSPSLTSEHKGSHARYEPGEEGIEGEGSHETAVEKLYNACQHHVGKICIHQLQPLRRARLVLFQEALYHRNQSFRAHLCSVLPEINCGLSLALQLVHVFRLIRTDHAYLRLTYVCVAVSNHGSKWISKSLSLQEKPD